MKSHGPFVRQSLQFFVERLANLPPNESGCGVGDFVPLRGQRGGLPTMGAEPGGHPARGPVQPGGKGASSTDRPGKPGQTEKDGLEDVLGVVRVGDQATGRAQHHRPVAGDQQLERLAIVGCNEAMQQHGVFRRHGFLAQPAKVALQRLDRANEHGSIPVGKIRPCMISIGGRRGGSRLFAVNRRADYNPLQGCDC
jgi:hypothetical protein